MVTKFKGEYQEMSLGNDKVKKLQKTTSYPVKFGAFVYIQNTYAGTFFRFTFSFPLRNTVGMAITHIVDDLHWIQEISLPSFDKFSTLNVTSNFFGSGKLFTVRLY